MTPILKESCKRIISTLSKMPDAYLFDSPVDPVRDGVPDYFDVIKTPMDLSTVFSKLGAGSYKDFESFVSDVRLIFANCYTYNSSPESAQLRKMADTVSVRFERFVVEFYSNPAKLGADEKESAATVAARKKAEARTKAKAAPPVAAAPRVAAPAAAAASAAPTAGGGEGEEEGGAAGEGDDEAGTGASPGKKPLAGAKRSRPGKAGAAVYTQYAPGTPLYNFWLGVETCWDDLGYVGPSRRVPIIGSKKVDLFELYDAVNKAGGYDLVTGFKAGWTTILRELPSLSGTTQESNGSRLKRGYERCLLEYEYRMLKGWDPTVAVGEDGEQVPVYTAGMAGFPQGGCGIPHEVAERLGPERVTAFATKVGQNATVLAPGVMPKLMETGGRGKGGKGGDDGDDGGEGEEGGDGGAAAGAEGGAGGAGAGAATTGGATSAASASSSSAAGGVVRRGFAVTGMTAAMQSFGNGPLRLRARDGAFAAASVPAPVVPYAWVPNGLARDLSLTSMLPLTAQGYTPDAVVNGAAMLPPAAWAAARRVRTDATCSAFGLNLPNEAPVTLPCDAGMLEVTTLNRHATACFKCNRRRAVVSTIKLDAVAGEASGEGAGSTASTGAEAPAPVATKDLPPAASFEEVKAAYGVPDTACPTEVLKAVPEGRVVWLGMDKDPSPLPPPMAFATCTSCTHAVCYECLFPTPESLGLAPGDAAGRGAFLRDATELSLASGTSQHKISRYFLSESVSWTCDVCIPRTTPTFLGLPWCKWCATPLGQAPATGRTSSYFASAGVGLTSWGSALSALARSHHHQPAAAGATAGGATSGSSDAAASASASTPSTLASSGAWPSVVRCSRCRLGFHSACAKRSGCVHLQLPAEGGAAGTGEAPLTILCRDCAGAFSTPQSSASAGMPRDSRLGLPGPVQVRFPVFTPSKAALTAEDASSGTDASPTAAAAATANPGPVPAVAQKLSIDLGLGGVAPAPGGVVTTTCAVTRETHAIGHLF